MLEHLRQRIVQTLADARTVTLSTHGPAGLQSGHFICELVDVCLFVLIPHTSDHLFNLETNPEVVVVNNRWNLRGVAHQVSPETVPPNLRLPHRPEAQWSTLVEIKPNRVNILSDTANGPGETIDIGDDDL